MIKIIVIIIILIILMIITIYSSQRNQSELEYVLHVLLENKINVINSKKRKVIKKLAIVYFFRRVKCNN